MNSPHEVTINIDNRTLAVPKGLTILEVARRNEIYIPTLCAHNDLTKWKRCADYPPRAQRRSRKGWSSEPRLRRSMRSVWRFCSSF